MPELTIDTRTITRVHEDGGVWTEVVKQTVYNRIVTHLEILNGFPHIEQAAEQWIHDSSDKLKATSYPAQDENNNN